MQKHIILTNGRTGSNNLVNIINQHPQIVNYSEVLGGWTLAQKLKAITYLGLKDSHDFIERLYSNSALFWAAQSFSALSRLRRGDSLNWKRRKQIKSLGFKDFHFNLKRHDLESFFLQRRGIKIIHLKRDNVLARYLSYLTLEKTDVAVSRNNVHLKAQKISVPIDELITDLDRIDSENRELQAYVNRFDPSCVLELTYEDFNSSAERRQELSTEVFNFLGVDDHEVEAQHRKIRKGGIQSSVANYEAMSRVLEGTRFQQYL